MTFEADALADDAALLRRLAHQLIDDPDAAEDASQQVALAYLQKRPADLHSSRAWLIAALRIERLKWLGRKPRRIAEDIEPDQVGDARPPAVDPASSEIRDSIERETRALREPYGSVVYASLFEDQPLDAIARSLDRPHATVRSQHKRGLELLRQRLDRRLGGRDAWVSVLLPMRTETVSAIARAPIGWTPRGARWAAAVLAIPLVSVGVWLGQARSSPALEVAKLSGPRTTGNPSAPGAPADAGVLSGAIADRDARASRQPMDRAETAEPAVAVSEARPIGTRSIPVRVVDEFGNGIPGAGIYSFGNVDQVSPFSTSRSREPTRLALTDGNGRALVEVPAGLVAPSKAGKPSTNLRVSAQGYASSFDYTMYWSPDPQQDAHLAETQMFLSSDRLEVRVRVLDDDGRVCEGGEVLVVSLVEDYGGPLSEGMVATVMRGLIHDRGFGANKLPGCVKGTYILLSWAPGRGISEKTVELTESCTIDLPPAELRAVRGRVLDAAGHPVPEAKVWQDPGAYDGTLPWRWLSTVADTEGQYELRVTDHRSLILWAAGSQAESARGTISLEVGPGLTEGIDLRLSGSDRIALRLVDSGGAALIGWNVQLFVRDGPATSQTSRVSDATGRADFPHPKDRSLSLAVYGPLNNLPPARLFIEKFEPAEKEQILVIQGAEFEPSAILGVIETPGWTAPSNFILWLTDSRVNYMNAVPLGAVGEPFAVEGISPGGVQLALRAAPAFVRDLGDFVVPEGSFVDLGEIVMQPPGNVTFVADPQGWIENRVETCHILLVTGRRIDMTATILRKWPTEPVELLPGAYRVVFTDRTGSLHQSQFQVDSGRAQTARIAR